MKRSVLILASTVALAACGDSGSTTLASGENALDINGAATEAQGDIDTYAASSLENQPAASPAPPPPAPAPSPTPSPSATPPAPGEPGGLPDDRTPVSEAPFTPESAQGAANVVQTYFALIEEGKYRDAWRLWSDSGKASGKSAAAFAASFDKYSAYHANVGAPGRIDSGAGQRHVEVPVQVYGTMKDGDRPFNMRGSITLHRTADIPGASAADKAWHISQSDTKPRP